MQKNITLKTYLIHAWCVRPFISYVDEVGAATPDSRKLLKR